MVFIWIGIVGAALLCLYTVYEFFALAFCSWLGNGGIKLFLDLLSRKLIPKKSTKHASYFSFYESTEKIANCTIG